MYYYLVISETFSVEPNALTFILSFLHFFYWDITFLVNDQLQKVGVESDIWGIGLITSKNPCGAKVIGIIINLTLLKGFSMGDCDYIGIMRWHDKLRKCMILDSRFLHSKVEPCVWTIGPCFGELSRLLFSRWKCYQTYVELHPWPLLPCFLNLHLFLFWRCKAGNAQTCL